MPIPSVVGALATFAIWIVSMATHPAARYAGPAWLAAGLVVYLLVRRGRHAGLLEHVVSTDEQVVPQVTFTRILVPISSANREEMVATAVKLAQDGTRVVVALHVIKVPLDLPLDAPIEDEEARAAESLAEAKALGADHGVGWDDRARADGQAIVRRRAHRRGPDRPGLRRRAGAASRVLLPDGGLRAVRKRVQVWSSRSRKACSRNEPA